MAAAPPPGQPQLAHAPFVAFALVVLGSLLAAWLLRGSMLEASRQRAGAELQAVGALKAAAIDAWREDQEADARYAATFPSVIQAAGAALRGPVEPGLERHVGEILGHIALHNAFQQVALLALDGRPLAEWTRPGGAPRPFEPALARAALLAESGSASQLDDVRSEKRPILAAAAVVKCEGAAAAVIALRSSMAQVFSRQIEAWPVPGASATTGLLHLEADAAVIYASRAELPDARGGWSERARVTLDQRELPAAQALAGAVGLVLGRDLNRQAVLAVIRPLTFPDWRLVTKVELREVEDGVARPFGIVLGLLCLVIFAGAAMLRLWWRFEKERVRAETRVREKSDLLELALAGSSYVFDWDLDAGALHVDGGWSPTPTGVTNPIRPAPGRRMRGSVEALVARLVHPEDREEVHRRIAAHIAGESPLFESEHRTNDRDGRAQWIHTRGRASNRDAAGVAHRITGVFSDSTEEHTVREQLEQAERLASLGTLAAGVAHEINNPLTAVLGNLEYLQPILAQAQVDAEVLPILGEMKDGAERVRDVVRKLRSFSRPGAGPKRAEDLQEELEAALRLTANEVRHRARIEKALQPTPRVLAAPHELGQVFVNLLLNAAQALPEGRAEEHLIRVASGTTAEGWARVEVRDTGPGIPLELQRRIFDPFFTTKAKSGGTGLGLAIANGIVTGAGGRIEVESQPSQGTVMRVLLPPAADLVHSSPGRPGPGPTRRLRVLVVDDEPQVSRAVGRALVADHDVVAVDSAAAALERIGAGEKYDAILCDVMMPQQGGVEFYSKLEKLDPELARRVVFITGGAFSEASASFLSQLANPCIPKPFQAAQLRSALAHAAAS